MKHARIEVNPEVMLGCPVIKGTRLTVEQIVDELAGGMTVAQILRAHPRLEPADIEAALVLAEEYMAEAT